MKTTTREATSSKAVEPKPDSRPPSPSRAVVNVDPQLVEALQTFAAKEYYPSGLRRAASEVLVRTWESV
jgi:hypothetical protein